MVDLTTPTLSGLSDDGNSLPVFPTTSSAAQIGALAPTTSSRDRGRVLGDKDWLGDEHILRDYQLLTEELRGNDPILAARTRFVDPIIAHQLRVGTGDDMHRALQRIVQDLNGNDVADFLFLPVNDASATDLDRRGTHWSLLLVDRRDRASPVAYHYDSPGTKRGAYRSARTTAGCPFGVSPHDPAAEQL